MGSEMGSESLSGPQFLHVKPSVYAGYGPLRAGHIRKRPQMGAFLCVGDLKGSNSRVRAEPR
mgnify:FL=1